jgi:hypothetical protein
MNVEYAYIGVSTSTTQELEAMAKEDHYHPVESLDTLSEPEAPADSEPGPKLSAPTVVGPPLLLIAQILTSRS